MLQERKSEGEFHTTLFSHCIDDESKFHNYFRMSTGTLRKFIKNGGGSDKRTTHCSEKQSHHKKNWLYE